jgi:hypothetical protein
MCIDHPAQRSETIFAACGVDQIEAAVRRA